MVLGATYQAAFALDVLDVDQEVPDAENPDLDVDPDEALEGHLEADASPEDPDEAPWGPGESLVARDESLEGLDASPVVLGGDRGFDEGLGVLDGGPEALDAGLGVLGESLVILDVVLGALDAGPGVLDGVLDSGESQVALDVVQEGPGGGLVLGVGQAPDEDRAGLDASLEDLGEDSESPGEDPASLDENQEAFDGSLVVDPAAQGVLGGDHPFPWVPWSLGADQDEARGETDVDRAALGDLGVGPYSPQVARAEARGGPWPRGAVALNVAGLGVCRGVPCAACEVLVDLVAVNGGAEDPGALDRSGNRGVGGRPGAVARDAVVGGKVGGSS